MTRAAALLALALIGCGSCDTDAPEPAPPVQPEAPPPVGWTRLDPPAAPGSLGAHLEATGDGVVATWLESWGKGHAVRMATLADDAWSEPVTLIEGEDLVANWADFPRTTEGGDGALYLHALHRSGASPYAYEARLYRKDGDTVEALGPIHTDRSESEHGFVSMVPSVAGVSLFWLDGRNAGPDGATALYTATASAAGVGAEARVDERVCDCCQTDAALLPSGPRVVYRDRSGDELRDIAIGTDEARLGAVHEDGWRIAGCPVNGPAIDGDEERLVVAWFTGAEGGAVHARFSEDGGRTFGPRLTVDDTQPPGRVDVSLVEGGAVVTWLGRSGTEGEVRARLVSPDGALGPVQRVGGATTRRASGFPVLARRGDRLFVAHRGADDALHVTVAPVEVLQQEGPEPSVPSEPSAIEGTSVAEAHVRTSDDAEVSLATLAEGPLLVAFYARWCQPCREELGRLEDLRSDLGAEVIAVSLDEGSAERVTATARRWGFEGRVLRDGGAAGQLGVPPLPGLFLIHDGTVRAAWRGVIPSADAVRTCVDGLVGQP